METLQNKNENLFTEAKYFEYNSATKEEEILKFITTSFINHYQKKENSLIPKLVDFELNKDKIVLAGFAVTSGTNRFQNALNLIFSNPLFKRINIDNTSVLLDISYDLLEIELDEIAVITDLIQEKANYNASIMLSVNEDYELKKAIALTVIIT